MEFNRKEEAKRAMYLAEKKIPDQDYNGAKKILDKAQIMYPNLDGLKQVMTIVDVYISASNGGGESDWYGILGVDPSDDEEAVKKQYKSYALLVHPDKNKFHGAEGAFKLVLDAWSLLSDKPKRYVYDQKRKLKKVIQKKKKSGYPSDIAKAARQSEKAKRWFEQSREKFAARTSAYDSAKATNYAQEKLKRCKA